MSVVQLNRSQQRERQARRSPRPMPSKDTPTFPSDGKRCIGAQPDDVRRRSMITWQNTRRKGKAPITLAKVNLP